MVQSKRGRYFSGGFKHDAVQLITEKGTAVRKVALDLDIQQNLLHQWRSRSLADWQLRLCGERASEASRS